MNLILIGAVIAFIIGILLAARSSQNRKLLNKAHTIALKATPFVPGVQAVVHDIAKTHFENREFRRVQMILLLQLAANTNGISMLAAEAVNNPDIAFHFLGDVAFEKTNDWVAFTTMVKLELEKLEPDDESKKLRELLNRVALVTLPVRQTLQEELNRSGVTCELK